MLKIKVKKGSSTLDITGTPSKYQLVSVTGLNPPVADINVSDMATSDGGLFNNARLQKRNIVLQIQPLGNLETRRIEFYSFMSPKSAITLDIQTDNRHVTIGGYVESMEIDYNANPQLVQISIICPDPYFIDVTQVSASGASVTNPSDIPQGAIFTFSITSSRTSIWLYNYKNHQGFGIKDLSMSSGDTVVINTIQGQKSVRLNGTNVMQYVSLYNPESKWVQLEPGLNPLEVEPSGIVTSFYPRYMGV